MSLKSISHFALTIVTTVAIAVPPALANGRGTYTGNMYHTVTCPTGSININKPVTINKSINIYKPVTINKSINIYKPVTINKNISIDKSVNIYKPVTINKNINITKNIDNSKNINITKNIDNSKYISIKKTIIINKGNSNASAYAKAFAEASASATASANASVTVYNGSYQYVNVHNKVAGGDFQYQAQEQCQMQEAVVVKSIHAVCVAGDREFEASHMDAETWVNTSYEGEILRCIPGSHLKVMIGDVVQTDKGMAGAYDESDTITCSEGQALRHYKDGMLKCAVAQPVKDCTERTNLRRWGGGDLFFTFRAQVCATSVKSVSNRSIEVTGLSLDGGVGEEDSGY